MRSTVVLSRTTKYDLDPLVCQLEWAIRAAAPDHAGSWANVLLKPNMLVASPRESAVCTEPAIITATTRALRALGIPHITAGDSPAAQPARLVARRSGILAALEAEGIPLVSFDASTEASHPEGRVLRTFPLARPVREAGALVNLARLKTHGLTRYTGACKNLFGCIPGTTKAAMHLRFDRQDTFARMLADLATHIRPALSLVDAIVSMEGRGPRSGNPRWTGFFVVSTDPVAADAVACRAVGIPPEEVLHLRYAAEAGAGVLDARDIEIIGDRIEDVRVPDFDPGPAPVAPGEAAPGLLRNALRSLFLPAPFVDGDRCIGCGECLKMCAAGALRGDPGDMPRTQQQHCIGCRCCEEVCPTGAIAVHRRLSPTRLRRGRGH